MIEFEVPSQLKIAGLRTDNAKEYSSQEFKAYLIDDNIHQEFSTPYRHHQNGIAVTIELFKK